MGDLSYWLADLRTCALLVAWTLACAGAVAAGEFAIRSTSKTRGS
ncbi:MAG TPA: hypothetical protein VMU56_03195 [Beijerinckiaceae bacterium]|nr:hypothetical protein [Beijerinckiaceae bacterium]